MTSPPSTTTSAEDSIRESFLRVQAGHASDFNRDSQVVRLLPEPAELPTRYIAQFNCPTFIGRPGAEPALYTGTTDIGINFPPDYQRKAAHANFVFTVLSPLNIYHPNFRNSMICTTIFPGSPLPDLLFTLWQMITFRKTRPEHPFNQDAAAWCRRNGHRFPTDPRPLRGQPAATPMVEFSDVES